MPNTQKQFNPAYSTIKAIYLKNEDGSENLNIVRQNTECIFERIEFVENINDVLPNGVLIVKDTKDILSRIKQYKINKIDIEFLNGTKWYLEVTSVSYINNAASDTEENFVGIYFSNTFYTKYNKFSLNQVFNVRYPHVFLIHDLVDFIRSYGFTGPAGITGTTDDCLNYALYNPLTTIKNRDEYITDDPFEYLNYIASSAVSKNTFNPDFMFWTEFDGSLNFKSFSNDPTKDKSFAKIKQDYRLLGIMDGDSVIQKLSDNNFYRKIYFYNTDPGYQFISKNYYYIRKTPKILDVLPGGFTGASAANDYVNKALTYQFQDEGQKYNIELIDHGNSYIALPGAQQLVYSNHWGYYDGLDSLVGSNHTLLGKEFGMQAQYAGLTFMGGSGYMTFVDNTEMWKNMFDMTAIHPDYSGSTASLINVFGLNTKLQRLFDIRYKTFLGSLTPSSAGASGACGASGASGGSGKDRLTEIRDIELQNFIMYSLCCMGKRNEDTSFFAALTEYELDNVTVQPTNVEGNLYRYKWYELKFDSPYGPSGPSGNTGSSGGSGSSGTSGASAAYYFHQVEKWDPFGQSSSATQDDSWAINLNERGLTPGYIPPGWISPAPTGFRLRPIGANTQTIGNCGSIFHIVKMHKISLEELLLNSNNTVYPEYIGKYMYYFTAENAFDGVCINSGSGGGSGSSGSSGSSGGTP